MKELFTSILVVIISYGTGFMMGYLRGLSSMGKIANKQIKEILKKYKQEDEDKFS